MLGVNGVIWLLLALLLLWLLQLLLPPKEGGDTRPMAGIHSLDVLLRMDRSTGVIELSSSP